MLVVQTRTRALWSRICELWKLQLWFINHKYCKMELIFCHVLVKRTINCVDTNCVTSINAATKQQRWKGTFPAIYICPGSEPRLQINFWKAKCYERGLFKLRAPRYKFKLKLLQKMREKKIGHPAWAFLLVHGSGPGELISSVAGGRCQCECHTT